MVKKLQNVTSPLTLSGLSPSVFYTVFVVALNQYGSSQPSSVMRVGTLEESKCKTLHDTKKTLISCVFLTTPLQNCDQK